MNRETILLQRVHLLTWVFIIGLVLSGATAIPLLKEMNLLANWLGVSDKSSDTVSGLAHWILKVREALRETDAKYPFLAYGTDWLAFGHFMIAVAFIGGVRGIPIYWRLIDCSFGVFGIIPVWLCRRWVREIEYLNAKS